MKKKLFVKLISTILLFITAVCAIIIIYAIVSVNSRSLFGYSLFIVKTQSMSGTIEAGEIILTKKTSAKKLQTGDIISFISSDPEILGQVNTHRIFAVEGEFYYTRGDANPAADPVPAKYGDILGKVIGHSGIAGKIISWGSKPGNMLFFIILPTVGVAFFELGSGMGKLKRIFKKNKTAV